MNRLADSLMRGYFRFIEPLQIAAKQGRRLRECQLDSLHEVPACAATCGPFAATCGPACHDLVRFHKKSIAKFLTATMRASGMTARFHAVPNVIPLGRYPDYAGYLALVRKKSAGNILREIQHARSHCHCRIINRHAHLDDIQATENSLLFRTSGPVVSAVLAPLSSGETPLPIRGAAVAPPACPRHYALDWGVFTRVHADGSPLPQEELVGFIYLRRVGNGIRVIGFMGHGAHLRAGIMKLLFADLMKWLLDRQDEAVQGLDFIQYGAIEHGALGLLRWKQRFGFEPAVFVDA